MLGGHDHVGDSHRLVIDVLHGNLALGVGSKPLDPAALADAGQFVAQLMRIHDRRGHQFRCFIRGVAKHQPLIAGALLPMPLAIGFAGIDTLRYVRTLLSDRVDNQDAVGVKNVVIMRITDLTNRLPRHGVVVQLRLGRDFSTHHHQVALGVGFAGHAAEFILGQTGVQYRVRNGVTNFVRVAFADRLGGEDIVFAH